MHELEDIANSIQSQLREAHPNSGFRVTADILHGRKFITIHWNGDLLESEVRTLTPLVNLRGEEHLHINILYDATNNIDLTNDGMIQQRTLMCTKVSFTHISNRDSDKAFFGTITLPVASTLQPSSFIDISCFIPKSVLHKRGDTWLLESWFLPSLFIEVFQNREFILDSFFANREETYI